MMYKHQIDECIDRLTKERKRMQLFNHREQAEYIQQKIDSLNRIRKNAPEAKIGVSIYGLDKI